MRLLVVVLTFLLFVGIIGFVLTNLDSRVSVTFWKTEYTDLPLFLVVIIAVFTGVCYAGIIGVAEGAHIRLTNRRLVREVQRLDAELNHARTQPPTAPAVEPDATLERVPLPEPKVAELPVAAPVYSADDEWRPDDDDDAYTGGRAV